jgi:two-component system, NtrC family, sensor kinase
VAAKPIFAATGTAQEVAISVSDTGFGIAPEHLPKIFLPFFTAKKKRGLGLGLPICDRIIKNHGGRIKVESQPGQGTTFEIYLPVAQ